MAETVYLLENNLGGIASLCANLIKHRSASAGRQSVFLLTNSSQTAPRVKDCLGADSETVFAYSSQENIYRVLDRLWRALPHAPGAIVSNSAVELALFSRRAPKQTVFQIVHDAFNLRLACAYEQVVDVMITHSRYYHEQLIEMLPHRKDSIVYLPYGIRLATMCRQPKKGPLRLIFLGRLTTQKGVYDLPLIDQRLSQTGVVMNWTIIGDGPERNELIRQMPPSDRVRYASPATNSEVLRLCAEGDVFVFPTRFEGFPVALLEAMSAGLVPVVTDLPSGIPEVVDTGSGFRVNAGDVAAFASVITRLNSDRSLLETLGQAARKRSESFDVIARAGAYHDLFARWAQFKRPWGGPLPIKHGSRLDQNYLPNWVTKAARSLNATLNCSKALRQP
jgi:glycosyltransferase involved in cell wall biosynthesis